MTQSEALEIGRELLFHALLIAAPALALSLILGLAISIFQAATSIQEQSLSFVPRIVALVILFVLIAPWMLQMLIYFTTEMLWKAAKVGL